MSCGQYDEIYADLACRAAVAPAARDRALAHASACTRCGARLETERGLSDALASLAGADAEAGAPPRVKAAALAAVRARAAAPAEPAPAPWWRRPALALAAAAALAALAALVGLLPTSQPASAPSGVAGGPTPPAPEAPVAPQQVVPQPLAPKPVEIAKEGPTHPPAQRPPRRRPTQRTTDYGLRTTKETVTDYIPLTYLDDATAMESGHVVRVEVPRAALASFGLSVDASASGETVKADVVIGDDGVARAIRFVR